jgi:hypothetical protein
MKKLLAICLMAFIGFGANAQTSTKTDKSAQPKTTTTKKKTSKSTKTKKTTKTTTTAAKKDEPKYEEGQPNSAVRWDALTYDFGTVAYNSDVSHVFKFKNVSKAPVSVKDVGTSCGCTTPQYSKEMVAPNATGSVTAKYDSSRIGPFTKTLTVTIGDETIILTIKGVIKEPETQAQPQGK